MKTVSKRPTTGKKGSKLRRDLTGDLLISGVLWANGDSWKEMRRFALTNLRDYGMGKRACEDKIIEECSYLMEVLKNWKGQSL